MGENSGSSSGRPLTLVKIWMPLAPIFSTARVISSSVALTLFIGTEATQAGKRSGYLAQMSNMPSLASRARAGDLSGAATYSTAGMESVSTC